MRRSTHNRFLAAALVVAPLISLHFTASAADRWWDGGNADIITDGDGISQGGAGTWNTSLANWDQGAGLPHVAWVNANNDNAIFGGTNTASKTITVPETVQVNRLITTVTQYVIGATAGAGTINFTGNYGDSAPAIDSVSGSVTINSKITGMINGGLVIRDGNTMTSAGRVYLNNTAGNDFVGNITMVSGSVHAFSALGDPANKLILKGGGFTAMPARPSPTM